MHFRRKLALVLVLLPFNLLRRFVFFLLLALCLDVQLLPLAPALLGVWTCSFLVILGAHREDLWLERALRIIFFLGCTLSSKFFALRLVLLAARDQVISVGLVLAHHWKF